MCNVKCAVAPSCREDPPRSIFGKAGPERTSRPSLGLHVFFFPLQARLNSQFALQGADCESSMEDTCCTMTTAISVIEYPTIE